MKQTNEVSKLAGISKRTLQYYDDKGVLTAKRSQHNYRLYDAEDLDVIWKIMIYKEVGFDLNEIKQLLSTSELTRHTQLQHQLEKHKKAICELQKQIDFISLILLHGMPNRPDETSNQTYKNCIIQILKQDPNQIKETED